MESAADYFMGLDPKDQHDAKVIMQLNKYFENIHDVFGKVKYISVVQHSQLEECRFTYAREEIMPLFVADKFDDDAIEEEIDLRVMGFDDIEYLKQIQSLGLVAKHFEYDEKTGFYEESSPGVSSDDLRFHHRVNEILARNPNKMTAIVEEYSSEKGGPNDRLRMIV